MKKSITAVLLVLAAILCLAGCNPDTPQSTEKTIKEITLDYSSAVLVKDSSAVKETWAAGAPKVTATYSDGTTGELTATVAAISGTGLQTATLTAGSQTATFPVYVKTGKGNSGLLPANTTEVYNTLYNNGYGWNYSVTTTSESGTESTDTYTIYFNENTFGPDKEGTSGTPYSVTGTLESITVYGESIPSTSSSSDTSSAEIQQISYTISGDELTVSTSGLTLNSSNHTGLIGVWTGSYSGVGATFIFSGDKNGIQIMGDSVQAFTYEDDGSTITLTMGYTAASIGTAAITTAESTTTMVINPENLFANADNGTYTANTSDPNSTTTTE